MATRGLKSEDRVQWKEGGWGQHLCTGTIVCEEKYQNGTNPYGHFRIRVDMDHWRTACHTASEMHSQCVVRSVAFNDLDLLKVEV